MSKHGRSSTWRLATEESRDDLNLGLGIIVNAEMMTMATPPVCCNDSSQSCCRHRKERFNREVGWLFVGGLAFDLVNGTLVLSKYCRRFSLVDNSRLVVSGMPAKCEAM